MTSNWYKKVQGLNQDNVSKDALRYLTLKYPQLRPLLSRPVSKQPMMYMLEEIAANPNMANMLLRQLQRTLDVEQISAYDEQEAPAQAPTQAPVQAPVQAPA